MRFLAMPLLSASMLVLASCGGGAEAGGEPTPAASTTLATTTTKADAATATATGTAQASFTARPSSTATPETAAATPATTATTAVTSVPVTSAPTQVPPTPTPTQPSVPLTALVGIQDDARFLPSRVEIQAGGTVTWSWAGELPHNAVSYEPAGLFGSSTDKALTYSFAFSTPGTYYYRCEIHPKAMQGVVVVK